MIKQYRLIVFDWEGTLNDTLGQVFDALCKEAKNLNLGEFNLQLAKKSVGLGLTKALKKIFPKITENEEEKLVYAIQKSLISRHSEVYLMPGAVEFIQQIKKADIKLAIASNKGQQSLQRCLHHANLEQYFPIIRCASQTAPKPDPQMLQEILEEFQVKPEETLVIGDSVTDMQMAKKLDVDAIGMNFYSSQQPEALLAAGAKAVFEDFESLAQYLQSQRE